MNVSKNLVAVLAIATTAGCATTQFNVLVDTYAQEPLAPPGRVAVLAATEANPMLGQEVQRKIENLVMQRGFAPVDPSVARDSADLVVLAVFGIGEPTTQYTGTAILPLGNTLWSLPQTRTAHTRWLIVGVARPGDMAGVEQIQDVPWVWYANTYSAGSSGDLRRVIDYLLVPTFEWFGENTGSRLEVTLREHDARVRSLREPMQH